MMLLASSVRQFADHRNSLLLAVGLLCGLTAVTFAGDESRALVRNGDFSSWIDNLPEHWRVMPGARNGSGNASEVIRGPEGGIQFSGDASTYEWLMVQQQLELKPRKTYRLTFDGRATGLKVEGKQYNNCYVGLFYMNRGAKRIGKKLETVSRSTWSRHSSMFTPPAGTATTILVVMLSKTGQLNVNNIEIEEVSEGQDFTLLVSEIDRNYPFFAHAGIDWAAHSASYAEEANRTADPSLFARVVAPMLAELRDPLVTMETPAGKVIPTFAARFQPNQRFAAIRPILTDMRDLPDCGFSGRTADGFGYVALTSLDAKDEAAAAMLENIQALVDAPALIVDLRATHGHDESLATRIAQRFVTASIVYAKSRSRSGPKHDDFGKAALLEISAVVPEPYTRPIACLIGPGCMGSGEALALMMKAIPQVRLLGEPTRGFCGSPQPVLLPNGLTVNFPRQQLLTPEDEIVERRGVRPHQIVELRPGDDDSVFEAATEYLRRTFPKASETTSP